MKATVVSTEQMVDLGFGKRARVWTATSDAGVPFQMLVLSVAVAQSKDHSQFAIEFTETHAPAPESPAFPLRMLLP